MKKRAQSQPISRVLLRRVCTALRAMTVIPLGASLPVRSSHLPADYASSVEWRPPTWCCSGWRLPRFTRSVRFDPEGDSSLWPCSSPSSAARAATYSGRALPGILLCGARTFLSPRLHVGQRRSGWLRTARIAPTAARFHAQAGRLRPVRAPTGRRHAKGFARAQRHDAIARRTDSRPARLQARARASLCRALRGSP